MGQMKSNRCKKTWTPEWKITAEFVYSGMSGLLQMVRVAYVKDGHGVITLLENQVIYSFEHLKKTTKVSTVYNSDSVR